MVGRPKPTALKLIEGNPGRRTLNELEPKFPKLEVSSAPEDLDETGKKIWFELGQQLASMGILQVVDTYVFWDYCNTMSKLIKVNKFLNSQVHKKDNPMGIRYPVYDQIYKANERGALIPQYNKDGTPMMKIKSWKVLPEVDYLQSLRDAVRKIEDRLGLSPVMRTKLKVNFDAGALNGNKGAKQEGEEGETGDGDEWS